VDPHSLRVAPSWRDFPPSELDQRREPGFEAFAQLVAGPQEDILRAGDMLIRAPLATSRNTLPAPRFFSAATCYYGWEIPKLRILALALQFVEPRVRSGLSAGERGIRISGPTFKRTTVRRARLSFFFGPSYTGCHRFSSPRMTTSSSRHRKVFLLVPRREETREGLRPFGCVGAMAKRGSRGTS
jgi:hypothetical protein